MNCLGTGVYHAAGGATFAGSFGPGRYRAYTCVDFKGDGYTLVSSKMCRRIAAHDAGRGHRRNMVLGLQTSQ